MDEASTTSGISMQCGVKIPLRDGVHLHATLYLPSERQSGLPSIFTMTPYIGQSYHEQAAYFAARGYPFLTVDVRGRGNSEGIFEPNINESDDAHDVIEWLARQSYCNGKVAMWGGSYGGYAQWAAARKRPSHLATIVPTASPYFGVDFPMRDNIPYPYLMQWLTLISGRTLQDRIFADRGYWNEKFSDWLQSGLPFKSLDAFLRHPSETFQEWISHPCKSSFWDRYNPTAEEYARISCPVLTITGSYDGDQPGALKHYQEHVKSNAEACHYLVIGPWDHAGTRKPQREFCGLNAGPESLLDLLELHLEWYAWALQGAKKPAFLRDKVAYYVMGADKWRYASSLEAITARHETLYLQSTSNPTDVFHSGLLTRREQEHGQPDQYVYDPTDVGHAPLECTLDPTDMTEQTLVHALTGKQLVYHSDPFAADTEVSGFFRLIGWISIDQPDTDFRAVIYEIALDGSSVLLSSASIRARYRESRYQQKLISTEEPLRYEFEGFTFVSRQIKKHHRLRLTLGPVNSIHSQKNYNGGGVVSEEAMKDARVVTVRLFHDLSHPSVLYVPIAA